MAKLSFILLFVVLAVAMKSTFGLSCNDNDCPEATAIGSDDFCSSRRLRIKCLREIADNTQCTDGQRDEATDDADSIEFLADFSRCEAGACNLVSSLATCLGLTAIAYLFGRMK